MNPTKQTAESREPLLTRVIDAPSEKLRNPGRIRTNYAGSRENQCAWRRGVSWQIVPNVLIELLSDPDPAKAGQVMQAMLQMTKIDIARLQRTYEQT